MEQWGFERKIFSLRVGSELSNALRCIQTWSQNFKWVVVVVVVDYDDVGGVFIVVAIDVVVDVVAVDDYNVAVDVVVYVVVVGETVWV